MKLPKKLLKHYTLEQLWTEILDREFTPIGKEAGAVVWTEVFRRTPQLREWLNARQINLLKSLIISEEDRILIKGKISEIMLYQRYDIPSPLKVGEDKQEKVKPKLNRDGFLKQWYADGTDKQKDVERDVSRSDV
jgi:hypothetical protein